MGLLDGLIDILVGGLDKILGEGVRVIKGWLVEILVKIIKPIIKVSVYAPAPQPQSGILFGRPVNSPWGMIYDMYWETMLPIGLLLLFVSFMISRAGAAWGMGPAAAEEKTRRGLYRGIVLLPASWYLVVAFLRSIRAFAGFFAPSAEKTVATVTMFSYSHPNLGGAAFALLVVVMTSLSLFAYLFLVLIHILRITAIFLIVYSLPVLLGLDFGQYPYIGKYSRSIYGYLPVLAFISIPVALTFRFGVALWAETSGIAIPGLGLGDVGSQLLTPLFMLTPAFIAVLIPVMMVLNAPGVTSLSILSKGALRDRRDAAKKGASKAREKASGAAPNWRPSSRFSLDDPRASGATSTGGSSTGGTSGGGRTASGSQLMPPKQTPSAIERRGPPGGSSSDGTLPPGDSDGQSRSKLPEGPGDQTLSEPVTAGQLPGGDDPQPARAGAVRSQGSERPAHRASADTSEENLTDISNGPVEGSPPALERNESGQSRPNDQATKLGSGGSSQSSKRSEPGDRPPSSKNTEPDTGSDTRYSEGLDDYLTEEQLDLSNRDPVAEHLGTASSSTQQQPTDRRRSKEARRRERERRREQHRETYVKNIEQFDEQPDPRQNTTESRARSDASRPGQSDDDDDQFAQRDAVEERSGPQTSNRLDDDPVDLDTEDYTIDEDDQ